MHALNFNNGVGTMNIIVFGPPGCGKTKHKNRIMKHFGLTKCVDEWCPSIPHPSDDSLLLTNHKTDNAIDFSLLADRLGLEA